MRRSILQCKHGWDSTKSRGGGCGVQPASGRPPQASRATTMDAKTNLKSGQLTLGDKSWSFPLYEGTIGPEVLDISKLYAQAGIFTYDPGFTSTGSCGAKITYIERDEGGPAFPGYPHT